MASPDLRRRAWDAYQIRLERKVPKPNRAKELAEARALIERVEARRQAMLKKP